MQTNVSGLLRNFPMVRQAALRGERVLIKTREGNLILSAERPSKGGLLGCMKGTAASASGADLTEPTLPDEDWKPSL